MPAATAPTPTAVDVTILSSGHDVADARLHREAAAMVRAGLRVDVVGLGDPGGGPAGVTVRTEPRGGMARRLLRALRLPFGARGRVLLTLDPDLVPAGLLAARLRRRPLVADVHEDYVALLADRAWVRPAMRGPLRRMAAACVRLAGRADLTVVADDHLPPASGSCRRRLVVRNLPDPALLPLPRRPGAAPPALRAVYIGDVRTSRGLRTMVTALAGAPGWELDIVGPVHSADQEWLSARLADDHLAGRVRSHGRMPPERAWQVADGASVGMLLIEDTPAFRAAVPTKLYEYLACGLAVLATGLPRVAEIVRDSGAGVVVDGAEEAAECLRRWADDPEALDGLSERALRWAASMDGPSPYDALASGVADLARGRLVSPAGRRG